MTVYVTYVISVWNDTMIYTKTNPWFYVFFNLWVYFTLIFGQTLGKDIAMQNKVME